MLLHTCSFSGDIHVLGVCSPQHANQEVLKQGYHYKRGHANIVGYFPCMALCTYNVLTMTVFFVFNSKFALVTRHKLLHNVQYIGQYVLGVFSLLHSRTLIPRNVQYSGHFKFYF